MNETYMSFKKSYMGALQAVQSPTANPEYLLGLVGNYCEEITSTKWPMNEMGLNENHRLWWDLN